MIAAWEGARAAVNALPPLQQASVDQVQASYAAVKALTDLLKTELLSAGMLRLPDGVASDTD
jgi:hypothetical protein